jgi:hypothetical protein
MATVSMQPMSLPLRSDEDGFDGLGMEAEAS